MGFITPCFIRKNTPELRKKLEELRYKLLNSGDKTLDAHNYDGKGSHKSIEEGRAIITFYGNLYGVIYNVDTVTKKGRIDCGTNEDLLLALAALRDDTDKFQWFISPEGIWAYNKNNDSISVSPKWRKATVYELIEHFKTEEEQ